MMDVVISSCPDTTEDGCCGLRGLPTPATDGPQLLLAETQESVCRKCAKKQAPRLVALLDLARAAERVGRIGRHTLTPPMTALLDIARAAEDYSCALPRRAKQAA
ncbi:MAG TPA: hypothetical protein VJY33_15265 [Isosphaeraceae bacterium]|nr:hypothetical protein [Isosphaeraceae bacterium]